MNLIASGMLILWLPVALMALNLFPQKKAVPYLFVIAWLLLPNGGFALPGIPDYGKVTATVLAVVVYAAFFDLSRCLSFRFRWYDIPMVFWGVSCFCSAIANDLGVYEGFSSILDFLFAWGFPYLIGRIYLDDHESMKELARAVVIGGICYIPLCLVEIRLSPMLHLNLYGFMINRGTFGMRFGGYRPAVFLATGLALGMWMTSASLMGFYLWFFGSVRQIRGVSIKLVTLALITTSILCKSTGALLLLAVGIGLIALTRWWGKTWLVWMLIAIPPFYCVTRTLNLWQAQEVVDLANSTTDGDRAQSFEYRLQMERLLADHALERPLFGWGRMGRNLVYESNNKLVTVPDGYWIIVLGTNGIIGLTCMVSFFLLPMIVTLRRFPISTWRDPEVGPVLGFAVILLLSMIDFLSNAMVMPLHPLAIGGILSQLPLRRKEGQIEAAEALSNASGFTRAGLVTEATEEFHRAIHLASEVDDAEARRIQAESFDGLGQISLANGRLQDAVAAFREALILRDGLAAELPDDEHFRDLAVSRDGLSRALAEAGQVAEAALEREHALQIWRILTANDPRNLDDRDHHVNTLNDLAWLLVTNPNPGTRDPSRALALIEQAVLASPDHEAFWNTLGVVRYRSGDWAGAIEALERSALSNSDGGTAFDHYFLAMAWSKLRREDLAVEWFERGSAWASRYRPDHPTLDRFREEAWSVIHQEV